MKNFAIVLRKNTILIKNSVLNAFITVSAFETRSVACVTITVNDTCVKLL